MGGTQKTSISKRLIAYLILFSSAIALITTAIQLYSEFERDVTRLSTLITEINTIYQEGLTRAVWATDLAEASLILGGISDLPDIVYAEIVYEGEILADSESGNSVLSPRDIDAIKDDPGSMLTSEIPLIYRHRSQDIIIGELYLYATLDNVYRQLYTRVWIVLVTNTTKTALVVLFLFLLFSRLVSRHLERVSEYLTQYKGRLPPVPLVLDRKATSKVDELDILVHDINSMYQNIETSLRDRYESENQVRLLLDSTGEGIYGVDLDGRCTFANLACSQLLGFDSVEEFPGVNMHEAIHHTRSDGSQYPIEECRIYAGHLKGERVHVDDEVFWRKDGTSFPVEYRSYPVKRDGEVVGSVVTFNDITGRRRAEKLIAGQHRQLEQLVDERTRELKLAQHELVLVIDTLNGYFYRDIFDELSSVGRGSFIQIYMTKGVEKLTGYSADELMDKNGEISFWDLIHPDDGESIWRKVKEAVNAHQEYDFDYRINTRDGEERWVYERGHGVYDENGEPIFVEGYVIDDHVRKMAETELDKYRDHLEQMVDERTQELKDAHGELVRQGRLAALGQLTATVSHELRNPLGVMRPSLHLIKKLMGEHPDKRILKAYDRIDRSIDRCDRIIDELLDFTRITQLEKKATRIDEWLDSIVKDQGIPKDIRVEINYSLKDLSLAFDADRLRRAIINVLDNACQAMREPSGEIMKDSIIMIKTETTDERIEIVITDTGIGIPEDVMARIFEPLFSTKNFGVGLGMPTIYQIMEQHEGGVEIESEPGKGTTVTLWLPNISVADPGEIMPEIESPFSPGG